VRKKPNKKTMKKKIKYFTNEELLAELAERIVTKNLELYTPK
jgi:hypothetical protein